MTEYFSILAMSTFVKPALDLGEVTGSLKVLADGGRGDAGLFGQLECSELLRIVFLRPLLKRCVLVPARSLDDMLRLRDPLTLDAIRLDEILADLVGDTKRAEASDGWPAVPLPRHKDAHSMDASVDLVVDAIRVGRKVILSAVLLPEFDPQRSHFLAYHVIRDGLD